MQISSYQTSRKPVATIMHSIHKPIRDYVLRRVITWIKVLPGSDDLAWIVSPSSTLLRRKHIKAPFRDGNNWRFHSRNKMACVFLGVSVGMYRTWVTTNIHISQISATSWWKVRLIYFSFYIMYYSSTLCRMYSCLVHLLWKWLWWRQSLNAIVIPTTRWQSLTF